MEDVLVAAVLDADGTGRVHLQTGPNLFSLDPAVAAMLGRMIAHAAAIARKLEAQKGAEPAEATATPVPARRPPDRLPGRAHNRRRNIVGARRPERRP